MTTDDLDHRIVRALRAEAQAYPLTVSAEDVENRLAKGPRVSWFTPMLVSATAVVILAIAVFAGGVVPGGPFGAPGARPSPTPSMPVVTELPVGNWVSNTALASGSICLAISVDQPGAAEHSAWWWQAQSGPECYPIPAELEATTADTSEFPLVRIAAAVPDGSRELALRFMGVSDGEINLHGVPFRRAEQALPGPANGEADCAVTRPDPAFVAPSPYPATAPPLYQAEWFGSEALWTMLDPDGEMVWSPNGEKMLWWSLDWPGAGVEPEPAITVVGTRLDGPGTFTAGPGTNAQRDDFGDAMLVGVEVPAPGCWQITASYRDAVLSYVVWVTDD